MKKKRDKHIEMMHDGEEKKKTSVQDQIKDLEDQVAKTKYNKKTQHAIGLYKAKLARLKEKQEARRSVGKGSGDGYSIRKTGDGTVIMLGFPSVGKSTLLNCLTNANSPVGHYAFTTLTVIPGLLEYKHAKIQVLDVPGVVAGAATGRGRGKEVLAVIRNADLIMIVLEVYNPQHHKILLKEVYDVNVRLNQKKPDVKIKKTARGGIRVGSTVKLTWLDDEMIKSVLKEFKISNADVLIREDITVEQLIDVVEENKAYVPYIVVMNKIDTATPEMIEQIKNEIKPNVMISAERKEGLEELREIIFNSMNFIRLYLKEGGKKADMEEPMIMTKGSTIGDVCSKLHRDFIDKFKFARVWGGSVRFPGMIIKKLDHHLEDEDILELHLR